MATVRDPKDLALPKLVEDLKQGLRRMVSTRAFRDPLHSLHPDLTGPQIHLLAALSLEQSGLSASSLAQRICASAPTITGMLDRLEHQGLVNRVRGVDDRRQVLVCLTERGHDVVRVLEAHVTEKLTKMLGCLEEGERQMFVSLLTRILDVIPERVDADADKDSVDDVKAVDVP